MSFELFSDQLDLQLSSRLKKVEREYQRDQLLYFSEIKNELKLEFDSYNDYVIFSLTNSALSSFFFKRKLTIMV
jgi:hypothetical protein